MKNYFIYFFSLFFLSQFFLYNFANSQSPGTPSSSYNFDYHSKGKKNDSQDLNILQENFNAVTNIIVQGNKRLESNLIINESQIETLGANEKSLSKAVKNLYKTGYFEDVQIFKDKNYIYINVKENPVIDLISVEGNTEISDELILEELTIKTRNVYSIDVIKSDADTIETLYKRQGFFSTYVEPKVIKIDDSRVNLVFEVYEGNEAKIKKVNFINNNVFSDSTLKDVISSSEYRWYEFWGSNDKFDKDRINYDKDLLKKYYYDNGYIDFRIVSVNSSLVDNRKDFVVNFSLFEGNRYKVSNVSVSPSTDPVAIKNQLVEQVCGRVRWRESILYMKSQGIDQIIEVGYGKVLTGMVRRIDQTLSAINVGETDEIKIMVEKMS